MQNMTVIAQVIGGDSVCTMGLFLDSRKGLLLGKLEHHIVIS